MKSAARPCLHPGCHLLVHDGCGFCSAHHRETVFVSRETERRRESSTARGYGYRWQQASKGFLAAHPLCQCEDCQEGNIRLRAATVTDHRIPHRGDMKLFWDRSNWRAMAKECHDLKTAHEDGGFGNKTMLGGVSCILKTQNT